MQCGPEFIIWLFVLCKHIFLIYIFTEPADGARQYGSSLPCPVDWGKTWTLCFMGNSSRDLGVALCFLMSHRICLSLCKPLSSKWQNHCFYGPARAGPLYEIRIWEGLCVSAGWMWHSASLGLFVPHHVVYGICQGLPSDILSINIIININGQYWQYW